MRKQDVFLVSGRFCGSDGNPRGDIINYVVCAVNMDKVRSVVATASPEFAVLSVTSLVILEATVQKIKASLSGTDLRWPVLIDPDFSNN